MLGISINDRATILDSRVHIGGLILLKFEMEQFESFTSATKDENRFLYDYSLILKNFKLLTITLSNIARSIPIHPYYLHNTEFPKRLISIKNILIKDLLYG